MEYHAFISYRRENGFLMAQVIYDRMKEKGIKCFMDLEELRSGTFNDKILDAIADAPNFILILPQNALDRCVNEDDWVRREIIAAVKGKKTIIPVMYDGFSWPKEWDERIPEEIRQLAHHQSVSMSKEYLPAMIDKIESYLKGIDGRKYDFSLRGDKFSALSATDFFDMGVYDNPELLCVDMAFHAGSEWRRDTKKLDMLRHLGENNIKLRVIVNDGPAVEAVCSNMRQPLKKYTSFEESKENWKELMSYFPNSIEVRVCPVPLLHRLYIIRNQNGTGFVNIKYYTYGNYSPDKDFRLSFSSPQFQYGLYTGEFDYLWNKSTPI